MPTEGTVHVIDDDEAARDSLAFLLEAAGLTACTHASAAAFLARLPDPQAGCVVTDIRMPETTGLDLLRQLRENRVGLPVIVVTGHADVPLAVEAMKNGALDFLEKPYDDVAMLAAVRSALDRHDVERRRAREREAARARHDSLSGRERDVLQGLVAGHANKRIAFDLGISPRTVEIYRAHLMTKMDAASLSDLVRMSLLLGNLPGPEGEA
ncbi:MAG TPA: response regulator FixJ [Xanthobacteraceae bacterium]|nr:response regulator FixJ [Xanthobacteraceae bacterium]